MSHALVVIADGSEELEAVTVIDILRRAEIEVTVAGLADHDIRASRGVNLRTDTTLETVAGNDFDLVVLPGGKAGAERLRDDARVRELLQRQAAADRLIGAICAAPIALKAAGLLAGRKATSYPGFLEPEDAELSEEAVVEDGNIITSRGPATAIPFALALVGRLCGETIRHDNTKRLLFDAYP